MCLPPEWGRRGPPKAFTCGGLWAWLWRAPCSELQVLLGRSHATSLRCPPAGGAEGVRDCSRLSIRKLFPEFPKPGRAGGDAAMFLLVRLWTETIPAQPVTRTLEFPPQQSQPSDTKFSFNPLWSDQANFIKLRGKQVPLSGLHFASGGCAVIGRELLMCSSIQIRPGSFLEWQKVGLAHSLCQPAY